MDQKFRITFIALLAATSEVFATDGDDIENTPPPSPHLITQPFGFTGTPKKGVKTPPKLLLTPARDQRPPTVAASEKDKKETHARSPSPLESLKHLEALHASLGQGIQQLKEQMVQNPQAQTPKKDILKQEQEEEEDEKKLNAMNGQKKMNGPVSSKRKKSHPKPQKTSKKERPQRGNPKNVIDGRYKLELSVAPNIGFGPQQNQPNVTTGSQKSKGPALKRQKTSHPPKAIPSAAPQSATTGF